MDILFLKQIVGHWASELPYKVKVYVFGSQSKGNANANSDVDIAVEFLSPAIEIQRRLLWFDNHDKWEKYLSEAIGIQVDLELYEGDSSPKLKAALSESSILLFSL